MTQASLFPKRPMQRKVPPRQRLKTLASPSRRSFLGQGFAGIGLLTLTGCDSLSSRSWFTSLTNGISSLTSQVQHLFTGRQALAPEYPRSAASATFRANGSINPTEPAYVALAANDFRDYRLEIKGLVAAPLTLSLAELRALPSRTQTTRHDCVEGWSDIATWTGVPLSVILDRVQPTAAARYVIFHCVDRLDPDSASPYYESIDLLDAHHPQTILAYELNDQPLPIANGAPLRLRAERLLGYKMAKYIMSIELAANFDHIAGGNGGFWEDRGYEWYGGI